MQPAPARLRRPRTDGLEGNRAGALRDSDAGFTLVEIVVVLGLFALIAAAGSGLVTTMLDAQRHTVGRLERLAEVERAMAIVTRDLTEIADAPLVGTGGGVAFVRHRNGWDRGGTVATRYRLAADRLERVAPGQSQRLLDGVTAVRWHYYVVPEGWRDHWPADADAQAWPAAVAVDIDLGGPPPNGRLRRVVDLPARPPPPPAPTSETSPPEVTSASPQSAATALTPQTTAAETLPSAAATSPAGTAP